MKKIKFGICEWASPIQGPYICKFVKEMGLDGIELFQGDYEHSFPLSNPYIQDAYLEEGSKYGVEFSAVAVNCLDYYGLTKEEGSDEKEIALMAMKKAVETAKRMKLPLIQFPAFGESRIETEKDFQALTEYLRAACQMAGEEGILIATENALSAEEDIRLLDEVGCENLKIYMDTQNPYLNKGYYAPDMIRKLGDRICEVHVKDGEEGELSAALLGEGVTAYEDSVKALCEIGYQGFVHLENYYDQPPMNRCDKDAIELMRKDIDILKSSFRDYNESI